MSCEIPLTNSEINEWNELYGIKKKNLNARDLMWSVFDMMFEIGRMIVSSLLVVFVPQDCDGHLCDIRENFEDLDKFNQIALGINFSTLGLLMILYAVIYKREQYLIYHLDENFKLPKTNYAEIFPKFPEIQLGVSRYNMRLYCMSIVCIVVYIVNMVISGIIVFGYYYHGYQTAVQYSVNSCLCMAILYRSMIHGKSLMILSNTSFTPITYNAVDPEYIAKKIRNDVIIPLELS